jgi:transcription initiation factor TFIID subunit 6
MAETVGMGALPEDAARELAEEVTYRVRQLVQDGQKFMYHGKRARMAAEDVDHALRMTGQEPLYGFQANEHIPFRFASGGGRDLHFTEVLTSKCINPVTNTPLG